jgi:hypothetical protein
MAKQPEQATPKLIGNQQGAKTVAAALANSQRIVDQAKAK